MTRASNPVLLAGTVPGESGDDVLRLTGPGVGDLVYGLTDGECGPRAFWVMFLQRSTHEGHPQLEKVRSPKGLPGMPDWVPAGYHDFVHAWLLILALPGSCGAADRLR